MKRALVVDDLPTIRSMVKSMLEKHGKWTVVESEDGESAWQALQLSLDQPEKFDLIVCDLKLSGISGIDLARLIEKEPRLLTIPFILITAQSDEASIRSVQKTSWVKLLLKPFSEDELILRLKEFHL